jgi:hypothetical protein
MECTYHATLIDGMSSTDWIAIIAAVIAFCSLWATFWQASLSRRHNRLSVRPHIDWVTSRHYGRPVTLSIVNNGLGPAIIESMNIHWDGQDYEVAELELPKPIHEFLIRLNQKSDWVLIGKDSPMKAGDSFDILWFEESSVSPLNHTQAINVLQNIGLTIVYRSMYGERFSMSKPIEKPQSA